MTTTMTALLERIRGAPESDDANLAIDDLFDVQDLTITDGDRATIREMAKQGIAAAVFRAGTDREDVVGGRMAALVLSQWTADHGSHRGLAERLPRAEGFAFVNGLIGLETGRGDTHDFALGVLLELGHANDPPSRYATDQLLHYCMSTRPDGYDGVKRARETFERARGGAGGG